MTFMEIASVGFTAGMLTAIILWLWGAWAHDKHNKRKSDDDSDIRIYHPVRDRDSRGMDRHTVTKEEMIIVIDVIATFCRLSPYEKEVMKAVREFIEESEE